MNILFSDEYSGFAKKAQAIYIVKPKNGAVACATEEIYKNIQNFYLNNDLKSIENQIKIKNCILLKNGEELEAFEGICNISDKNSVKLFKSKRVFLQKIYVPCFAVEMDRLVDVNKNENEVKDKNNEYNSQNSNKEFAPSEVENKAKNIKE